MHTQTDRKPGLFSVKPAAELSFTLHFHCYTAPREEYPPHASGASFFFYLKATFLSSFLLFSFFASATMSCVSGVVSLCSDFVKSIHNKFYNAVNQHEENEDEREHKYQTTFHRFGSFAPVRHGAQVKFFVDGHDYCWCVLSNNASGYS